MRIIWNWGWNIYYYENLFLKLEYLYSQCFQETEIIQAVYHQGCLQKWPCISFSKPFKHLFLWFLTAEGKQGSLSIYGWANTCKDPLRLQRASANVRFFYATSGHWRLTASWLAICLPDSFTWSVKWRVMSFWGGLNI